MCCNVFKIIDGSPAVVDLLGGVGISAAVLWVWSLRPAPCLSLLQLRGYNGQVKGAARRSDGFRHFQSFRLHSCLSLRSQNHTNHNQVGICDACRRHDEVVSHKLHARFAEQEGPQERHQEACGQQVHQDKGGGSGGGSLRSLDNNYHG